MKVLKVYTHTCCIQHATSHSYKQFFKFIPKRKRLNDEEDDYNYINFKTNHTQRSIKNEKKLEIVFKLKQKQENELFAPY